MCGITGLYAFNETGRFHLINLSKAVSSLEHRGPDGEGTFLEERVGLGHRRLSVIDLSGAANQPMTDESGRFTIVYNGEIFNYQALGKRLRDKGYTFRSASDTEVLLKMYMDKGEACLHDLHGFFSFAIYDRRENSLFLARDRYGVKPLYYYYDEDKFIFGSEMKAVLSFGVHKGIDFVSLLHYLQLNYIPAPHSIFKNVKKLEPGHCISMRNKEVMIRKYYSLPYSPENVNPDRLSYGARQDELKRLMEQSVADRLIADVPVGVFLSGGIDSSIIAAIASRLGGEVNTFSIGYSDEPFFDETTYAELVARKFHTHHTVFKLTNSEMRRHIFDILDCFDEPFADSSAIPVYILSKHTRQSATVALSGDGADEAFSGYHKHSAALRASRNTGVNRIVMEMDFIWNMLPKSRNNPVFNKFRQLARYSAGLRMDPQNRYWRWASIMDMEETVNRLSDQVLEKIDFDEAERRKMQLTNNLKTDDFNEFLRADMRLVLPNDMLTKVDMMSMANSLEVRCPFLDHRVVEFAFRLPVESKIDRGMRKKILQDAYRDILPPELYKRPKHGFEVPLFKWFRNELKELIFDELLEEKFVLEQNIFNPESVKSLKSRLFSVNPGDAHAQVWALTVFQWWWKKYYL